MRRRPLLFPLNIWPPFVDALALVLAAFVVLMVVALISQRGLVGRLRDRDRELTRLREDKARIERRLRALAPRGSIDVDDGKVILQGEVLFDTNSDALKPAGAALMTEMGHNLPALLAAEPTQMVLVGGHTDDRALRADAPFASNWDLSAARALAVTRVLIGAGVDSRRIFASGFGAGHPRAANTDEAARRKNRRIEVLLVPMGSVASR